MTTPAKDSFVKEEESCRAPPTVAAMPPAEHLVRRAMTTTTTGEDRNSHNKNNNEKKNDNYPTQHEHDNQRRLEEENNRDTKQQPHVSSPSSSPVKCPHRQHNVNTPPPPHPPRTDKNKKTENQPCGFVKDAPRSRLGGGGGGNAQPIGWKQSTLVGGKEEESSVTNDALDATTANNAQRHCSKQLQNNDNNHHQHKQDDDDDGNVDPYGILRRFVHPHMALFATALAEINQGQKESHWMWYLFPTPPFLRNGVEVGSTMNRHYALRGDDQVVAFLRYSTPDVDLRQNYLALSQAVAKQLQAGRTLRKLFPYGDDKKVRSSLQLFQRVGQTLGDDVLHHTCRNILDLDKEQQSLRGRSLTRRNFFARHGQPWSL